jgi:hypothetical protein
LIAKVFGWSGKGQENDRGIIQSFSDIGGEPQVMIDSLLHDFFKAWLVNWWLSLLALLNSEGVNIIDDELY